MSAETASPPDMLPDVMQDEDGSWYFAPGHVDPLRFVFAVVLDLAANVSTDDAMDFVGVNHRRYRRDPAVLAEVLGHVEHVWYRYDDPNNDEHMALCGPTDDGAISFTRYSL